MKRLALTTLMNVLLAAGAAAQGYPITPVAFTQVKVARESFWGQRLEASRRVTIPLAFEKCESEGRYKNFEQAAVHVKDTTQVFNVTMGFSFDDTDPYKTIEGASYLLSSLEKGSQEKRSKEKGSKALRHYVDSVIDIIGSAQEPDGYLYTARTQNPAKPHDWAGPTRWSSEENLSHELYNLGHMVEAAVAHYQATGSRRFLDIACRYADCVCREVGPGEGQAHVVPGHQIAEMALARLYLVTGEQKYLDEAKYLLDYRGRTTIRHEYSQAHLPVVEQTEAVGHAVRAAYMYAGMADVAALTGDTAYVSAIGRIWQNIVGKKLYITGGIGATNQGEAFGKNYELPNATAYCETCAAIGNVYVNHRLFLLHGESKYYDVLERTLYNGLIAGMSLDGGAFFYPNPLASDGQHRRQAWFGCACCPSNLCRFIPSVPGYVYAVREDEALGRSVYVNLFMPNSATLSVGNREVTLHQQTRYPWDGAIEICIDKNTAGAFFLKVRLPGWLRGQPVPSDLYQYVDETVPSYSVTLNSKAVADLQSAAIDAEVTADGYLTLRRQWKRGDVVRLHFDMMPRVVKAARQVSADRGRVCVERGPLVYCAEAPDNEGLDLGRVLLNQHPTFDVLSAQPFAFEAADGPHTTELTMLTTDAQQLTFGDDGRLSVSDVCLKLIPYYAWCHRGSGQMRVWLPKDLNGFER